jgi:hypothetical protein
MNVSIQKLGVRRGGTLVLENLDLDVVDGEFLVRHDSLGSLRSPPPRGSGPLPPERPRVRGPSAVLVHQRTK